MAHPTAVELRALCLGLLGAREEFPFRPELSVFKVGGKVFALSALSELPLCVSLKCAPELGEQLRLTYAAIVPGYHLNKRHWLTITIDDSLPEGLVADLIEGSHELVRPRRRRREAH
jgi:predicted DNA-binding protein (MmcQ/YjbR family)